MNTQSIVTRSGADRAALSSRAMLVRLTISQWSGRSLDRTVTAEVARTHGVATDAGRYNKVLIDKKDLEAVTKAVSALRDHHYTETLPWLDDGARVLPTANFITYRQRMYELKDSFDRAVADFVADFPRIQAAAKLRLNTLYREADYPSDVGRLFGIRVGFLPFPDAQDLRVDLSGETADSIRRTIERDVRAAAEGATTDLYQRIAGVVGRMAERLRAYRITPDTNKVEGAFRDSLVENVRELVDLLPRLNFTQDPKLDDMVAVLRETLCLHDADTLRKDEGKRMATLAAADAILAQMGGYVN